MPRAVRVSLPSEIAEELVAEGIAVRPFETRDASLGHVIGIVVEAVNTGSAVVAIVVAGNTCRRIARGVLRQRLPEESNEVTMTITSARRSHSVTVDPRSPEAEDTLLTFLISALDAE
jgi:hypothetical protein